MDAAGYALAASCPARTRKAASRRDWSPEGHEHDLAGRGERVSVPEHVLEVVVAYVQCTRYVADPVGHVAPGVGAQHGRRAALVSGDVGRVGVLRAVWWNSPGCWVIRAWIAEKTSLGTVGSGHSDRPGVSSRSPPSSSNMSRISGTFVRLVSTRSRSPPLLPAPAGPLGGVAAGGLDEGLLAAGDLGQVAADHAPGDPVLHRPERVAARTSFAARARHSANVAPVPRSVRPGRVSWGWHGRRSGSLGCRSS